MAVDPDGVVKGFDVLEHQTVSVSAVFDFEAVEPFAFDERMKGFDAGVVIGVPLVAVAELELFGDFAVGFGNVLASPVRMKDQRGIGVASGFGLFDGFYDAGDLHGFGERPGDDLAGVKVHDAGEVNESVRRPDVGDVRAPDGIGTLGIELFVKDVVKLFAEIGITGGGDPGLDPLGFDPHLTHILADGALRDDFTALAKLDCDLRRAVDLFGLVVDLPDPFFEMFFPAFCFGRLVTEKRAETGTGETEFFQHSGNGDGLSRSL